MKVLYRGMTEAQKWRVGTFKCPECTSLIEFDAYDRVRWLKSHEAYYAVCPVCGEKIPDTEKVQLVEERT